MENRLKKLFDYQKFAKSSKLSEIIGKTEAHYGAELSDSDLDAVCAAGYLDEAKDSELRFVPI